MLRAVQVKVTIYVDPDATPESVREWVDDTLIKGAQASSEVFEINGIKYGYVGPVVVTETNPR